MSEELSLCVSVCVAHHYARTLTLTPIYTQTHPSYGPPSFSRAERTKSAGTGLIRTLQALLWWVLIVR